MLSGKRRDFARASLPNLWGAMAPKVKTSRKSVRVAPYQEVHIFNPDRYDDSLLDFGEMELLQPSYGKNGHKDQT